MNPKRRARTQILLLAPIAGALALSLLLLVALLLRDSLPRGRSPERSIDFTLKVGPRPGSAPGALVRGVSTAAYPTDPPGEPFRLTFDDNAFPEEHFEEKGLPAYANYWDSRLVAGRVKVRGGEVRISNQARDWDGRRFTSGGIQSVGYYGYGDLEFRLKASAMPGVVTALYLYNETADVWSAGGVHDELDIELAGALHPGKASIVSYHNAPADIQEDRGAEEFFGGIMDVRKIRGLARFDSTTFNTYRISYRAKEIVWTVNGVEVRRTRRAVPASKLQIHFDTYHNVEWDAFIDTPPRGSGVAELDWIRFTPAGAVRSSATRSVGASRKSFPQHVTYSPGTIKPRRPQAELDASVTAFYEQWKRRYLVPGCGPGRYYIHVRAGGVGGGGGEAGNSISSTEGHGYGMIITALMAGHDPHAKETFDGLYRYFKAFPSRHHPALGAWNQVEGCVNAPEGGDESCTDCDMDIAYALFLADEQWGSLGTINYRAEAQRMINAILAMEVHPVTSYLMLGDYAKFDPAYAQGTRPSDFILHHLKVFRRATGERRWQRVVDRTYHLLDFMQRTYSPRTGLLPDFIDHTLSRPRPAAPNFLEEPTDGQYSYNASRVPWRITTDYLMTGDVRAKRAVQKINHWIREKTQDQPADIRDGYTLAGDTVGTEATMPFVAPFAVGAMIEPTNQAWLDGLWGQIVTRDLDDEDYYGNTQKMLALLVLSGNWWAPGS